MIAMPMVILVPLVQLLLEQVPDGFDVSTLIRGLVK